MTDVADANSGTTAVREGYAFDEAALVGWMEANVEGFAGPLTVEQFKGGQSNPTYKLVTPSRSYVLRRKPPGELLKGAHAVEREAKVLSALHGAGFPAARVYGLCTDDTVLGTWFYVMEMVEGRIFWDATVPGVSNEERAAIFDAMNATIAQLHGFDPEAIGLGDYGKPGPFLERQVDRWAGQLASYKERYGYAGRDLPGYAATEEWLRANVLPHETRGIIHGDVGTPNMMFHHGPPARLAAMIDWELSTIGDPMIDMGWFTGGMRDEDEPGREFPTALNNPAHFPTRQELGRYYCAGTGRDIRDFDYFSILAKFKSGCLLEYKVAQAEAGILSKETGRFFARIVEQCFVDTSRMVERLS